MLPRLEAEESLATISEIMVGTSGRLSKDARESELSRLRMVAQIVARAPKASRADLVALGINVIEEPPK